MFPGNIAEKKIIVMFIDSSDKYDIHIKCNNTIWDNTHPFLAYLSQHTLYIYNINIIFYNPPPRYTHLYLIWQSCQQQF